MRVPGRGVGGGVSETIEAAGLTAAAGAGSDKKWKRLCATGFMSF